MSKSHKDRHELPWDELSERMSDSPMMAHLLESLEAGVDIGDFGRLAFIIIARYFMDEGEIVSLIASQPEMDQKKALALLNHIRYEDYRPPRREQILEWQAIQDFAICPDAEDPESCDVYRQLRFPDEVYASLKEWTAR